MVGNQGDGDEAGAIDLPDEGLPDDAILETPLEAPAVVAPPAGGLEPEEEELYVRIEAAQKLLPSWFILRMMSDSWYFGLLTVSNTIIGIQCIDEVYQAADGSIWMDVTLLDTNLLRTETLRQDILIAPTSRTRASINASHVVAAFELEDT